MLLRKLITITLVVFMAVGVNIAFAAQDHDHADDEMPSLGAHIHGEAALFVIYAGGQLLIEFESPAMSLLGFEHYPHDEEQKARVVEVAHQLSAVDQLFSIAGGDCQVNERHVEMPFAEKHHDHENHAAGKVISSHSDVFATYDFKCTDSGRLRGIELKIFNRFPGLQRLNAQWADQDGQSARILTAEETYIPLQ